MAEAPQDAASLIDPDAWWNERRILARSLWDAGQTKLAYKTASMHAAQSPTSAAEAEFHAGWIALRALKDPKLAEAHFTRLLSISTTPQSLSRGYYWLGRSIAASSRDPADAYRRAAHYGTTFYGQLAAAKIGASKLEISTPAPSPVEIKQFEAREAVSAIRRLQAAGHGTRARAIYYALAEELASIGEIALLASEAEKKGITVTDVLPAASAMIECDAEQMTQIAALVAEELEVGLDEVTGRNSQDAVGRRVALLMNSDADKSFRL